MSGDSDLRGIAIIGMACRFPGSPGLDAFWENLTGGVDCIRHFEDEELLAAGVSPRLLRQPDYVKAAPVIEDFDRFDAAFFEYSPREARLMDPQQRVLLETAWHAMEDAGSLPGAAANGRVGAFMGSGGVVTSYLLAHPALHGASTGGIEHLANDKDFVSTRLSYKLGLTGPSVNVQTACSTSLVAVHLACQSILDGDCDMALAGAATVRVPHLTGYRYREGDIMSPDGRCRAYDAEAKGTVFGSGAGIVVLKHLEDAMADGDRIYAVIRGSAINNDGAEKMSFTASSTEGQARAMIEAFAAAEIDPSTIGLVEGHGTGTVVGDPLEVQALSRVFQTDPATEAGGCWLGSVKTNIGHLEQTAGVASLIKAALAVHHGRVPPSLNFRKPNGKIDFERGPFRVPTEVMDFPARSGPRRAAVNSLGLGGTNAFALLERAPLPLRPEASTPPVHVLTLSARTKGALGALVDRWRDHLATLGPETLGPACHTAAAGRAALRHRIAVSGIDAAGLSRALIGHGAEGRDAGRPGRIAFLFPGQGAQYPKMAAALHEREPAFREPFDRVAARLKEKAAIDLARLIFGSDDAAALAETRVLQPALFAVEFALAEMLRSFGITPHAVLGHSVGAFAAGAVAGIWTPEEAADLIARRAALMGELPEGGAMAAIFAGEAETAALLDGLADIGIAALNSPDNTVVSGKADAVAEVSRRAEAAGIGARALRVSHAFHSTLMTPAADPLATFAEEIAARAPSLAFVSDMTGEVLDAAPQPRDLADHILRPVRFADGLRTLHALGCTDFVEIGPGGALRGFAAATLPAGEIEGHGLLDPRAGDFDTLGATLASLWEKGHPVDAAALYRTRGADRASVPLYPFERVRYWLDETAATPSEAEGEGLSGAVLQVPGGARHFQARYSAASRAWLPDHRVYGHVTLPVVAGMLALAEAAERADGGAAELRDLTYEAACLWGEEEERLLHLELPPRTADARAVLSSASRAGGGSTGDWTAHIRATLAPAGETPGRADLDRLRAEAPEALDPARFYAALDHLGLNYGPGFRNVRALSLGPGRALARVALGEGAEEVEAAMHPALLDACLHLFPAVAERYGDFSAVSGLPRETFLPITVERFALFGPVPGEVWSDCRRRAGAADEAEDRFTVDVRIFAGDGRPVAVIEGLTVKSIPAALFLPRDRAPVEDWLYAIDWTARPALPAPEDPGRWIVIAERASDVAPVTAAIAGAGGHADILLADDLLTDSLPGAEGLVENPDAADDTGAGPGPGGPDAPHGVLLATALSATPVMLKSAEDLTRESERQFRITKAALALVSERLAGEGAGPRLSILTRGAQAPLENRLGGEAMQAVLWGHGRVIALEHPNVFGRLVDIDEQTPPEAILAELASSDGEDQIALRDAKRYAPRLVRRELDRLDRPVTPPIRPDRSYLVTGGLGVLGLKVADWLAAGQGARHLWLVSRRQPSSDQTAAIEALRALGATVTVVSADIGDGDEVRALIERIATDGPPLDGVFHCAGLLDDGIMIDMDWAQYHRVTLPKIEGTWALHQATADLALGHFVLFSSILSVIGSMGQLNYVAGNAFQDALVAYRRRLGLAAVAMNWGPWEDAGLATHSGDRGRAIWRARGTEYIPSESGLEAMTQTLAHGFDHGIVTLTDWSAFVAQFTDPPRLYEGLSDGRGQVTRKLAVDRSRVLEQLREAGAADRHGLMVDALGQVTMAALQLDTPPETDLSLREAGLDSLLSITVINDIESIFGIRLPARALLRGPSLDELAAMVMEAMPDLPAPAAGDGGGANAAFTRASARGTEPGAWLVTRTPRPEARIRLVCFPFAGGGSAVFDDWGERFDPAIEIVAVEAPGRLGRINEEPVRTVEDFARGLLPELTALLDRPYAVLGHCLGGLTLYETLRFLDARGKTLPQHIFVSGARPPSVLRAPGDFENELETRLRQFVGYRSGTPGYTQPDEVFAEIVRAFGISESSRMLDVAELRELVLPTVRAEFAMADRYVYLPEDPFPVPITCFRGTQDAYFRDIDARIWGKFTSARFELFNRDTGHFAIVEDFDFIREKIEARLLGQCAESS